MERRIELETRGRPLHEITMLNIDNCRSNGYVEGFSSDFSDLVELSLVNTGLTSLKNFPVLPKLHRLELADNRLTSGLHILERVAPQLRSLNISNNRLKSSSSLEPLGNLKELRYLEIGADSELAERIFEQCAHIKAVDGKDRNGLPKTYEEAVLEGEFEKRISPSLLNTSPRGTKAQLRTNAIDIDNLRATIQRNRSGGSNNSASSSRSGEYDGPKKKPKMDNDEDYRANSSDDDSDLSDTDDEGAGASRHGGKSGHAAPTAIVAETPATHGTSPQTLHVQHPGMDIGQYVTIAQSHTDLINPANALPPIIANAANAAQSDDDDYSDSDSESEEETAEENSAPVLGQSGMTTNLSPQHLQCTTAQMTPPQVGQVQLVEVNGQIYSLPANVTPTQFLTQAQQQQPAPEMVESDEESSSESEEEEEEYLEQGVAHAAMPAYADYDDEEDDDDEDED